MKLNKLSKEELREWKRGELIGLASFQERIKEVENEIEAIKLMSIKEIQKKYWVETRKEAIAIFKEELDEANSKLEDFEKEKYQKEDYE